MSRNKKCKVVGFGNWSEKTDWPLAWLKPVQCLKIFGIFISNSYQDIVKTNWDFRFKKFSDVIYSWSSRILDTVQQRVEVIRLFALSRVYYVASVLPIAPSLVKKFEALMGKFLWNFSGKILRVAIDEMKNPKLEGGLNLPCLASMADSLLASQCLRMINSGDMRYLHHLDFWMGELLVGLVPWMGQGVGAVVTPSYFSHLGQVVASLMIGDTLTASTIKTVTNKMVYASMTSTFPPPKIVRESNLSYEKVWSRLHCPVVEPRARDTLFLLLHNKLPVIERLFRIRVRNDPYCQACNGAEIADIEHFFCSCEKVKQIWVWVKMKVVEFARCAQTVSDWDLLNLFLPDSQMDLEAVWLISSYVLFIWENIFMKGAEVKLEQFFGFLTYKYRKHQLLSKHQLKHLNGVS